MSAIYDSLSGFARSQRLTVGEIGEVTNAGLYWHLSREEANFDSRA